MKKRFRSLRRLFDLTLRARKNCSCCSLVMAFPSDLQKNSGAEISSVVSIAVAVAVAVVVDV